MSWKLVVAVCMTLLLATSARAQSRNDSILYIYANRGDRVEIGTGFFIDAQGVFVTAYHVLNGATSVEIYDRKSTRYSNIQLLQADPTNDIAILTTNTTTSSYLRLTDEAPSSGAVFEIIGHPWGFQGQSFQGRATQDGFADSTKLVNAQGRAIFSRSIPVIPLDLTIYNGMSGAPIINTNGLVIGVLSGSFNVGGSLAWGVPSRRIILLTSTSSTPTDLSKVIWRPMDSVSAEFRGFAISKLLGISETVDWLNAKWRDRGARDFNVNGFTAHISTSRAVYDEKTKALRLEVIYSLTGEIYRSQFTVSLEDASRATSGPSFRTGPSAYYLMLECPRERSCISPEVARQTSAGWRTLAGGPTSKAADEMWLMTDLDSVARSVTAVNHLIQLHGGPVERTEAFGIK